MADSGRVYQKSLVSPVLKWGLFAFNMFFWICGLILIAIGIWAFFMTRDMNTNTSMDESRDVFDVFFDFTIIFMVVGSVMFLLSFFGMLGALRENICLLKTFAILLGIIFLTEVIISITVLALSGKAQRAIEELLADKAIEDYRDDINRQNIIDWFQETFECCGVGDERWRAWESNPYFNCSSPAFEACSVPYSCCKNETRFNQFGTPNTRCGSGMLEPNLSESDVEDTIFTTGCVDAVIKSVQDNIAIVGGVSLAIVIPQILGIFMARFLWVQIEDQRSQYS